MNTKLRNAVLAASAMLACAAGPAQASTTGVLTANVPFSFVVNGQSLPAGKYDIERDDLAPILLIRNVHTKRSVIVETIPEYERQHVKSRPVLTFSRHENEYRLVSIQQSTGDGWELMGR